MMLKPPEATAVGVLRAVMDDPALQKDDVMPAPALAIWAGTRRQLPDLGEAREVLPNYQQVQVAGTGHFVMMEKPEEFNRLLITFIDQCARQASPFRARKDSATARRLDTAKAL